MGIEVGFDESMYLKFPQTVVATSNNLPRIERTSRGPSLAADVQLGFVFL